MIKDEVGNKYGRLTVVSYEGKNKDGAAKWLCLCDCGKEKVVLGKSIRSGNTSSCGCYNKEQADKHRKTHGYKGSSIYTAWHCMLQRCLNENNKDYKHYGGRGIRVCEEWLDAGTFCSWADANGWKKGLQLDRRDNSKGYSPDNCRFVTSMVNNNNKRPRSDSSTGYIGVKILSHNSNIIATVCNKHFNGGRSKHIGTFSSVKEAVEARNKFITDNGLPGKIQVYKVPNKQ